MDAGPAPVRQSAPSPFDDETLIPRKPFSDDARFDVTAMVDLVFMMNIFFLVTWAEMARAEIDLPTARHCSAATLSRSIIFTVTKGPSVFVGDGSGGIPLSPNEIDQKVTAAIEAGKQETKDIVLIKAEKEVQFRDIARLTSLATAAGGVELMLAVIEKR